MNQKNKNIIGTATIRKTRDNKELIVILLDNIEQINFDKNKQYRIVINKEKLEKGKGANAYLHEIEKPEKLKDYKVVENTEKEKLDMILTKLQELNEKINNLEEKVKNLEKIAYDL